MSEGKNVYDLADETLGGLDRLDLENGLTLERGPLGDVLLNGQSLNEAPAERVKSFISQARRRGPANKYLDPAQNPMIKTD